MIAVTKLIRYSNQDFDEQQALRRDLAANPRDYLAHEDGIVRSYADWAREYAGLGSRGVKPDPKWEDHYVRSLYNRLREIA